MTNTIQKKKLAVLLLALGILLYAGLRLWSNKPLDENEYRQRAQALTNSQDWTSLDKLSQSWAFDHPRSAFAHLARGDVLRIRGDMPAAAAAYGKALELDQGNFQLWAYHGVMMLETGSFPKAKESCAKSIALNPNHAEAWYCLALANAELSDRKEASSALARLETLNPPLLNAARGIIREHACRRHPELGTPLC